jgi:hypothetical protein
VVTASWDHTARLWDVESGKQVGVLRGHDDVVTSAAFSPDGRRVVTASYDRTARLWDVFLTTKDLVDDAKLIIPRCLTSARRTAAFLETEPPAWCIEMAKWPYNTSEWKRWLADTRADASQRQTCRSPPDHDLSAVSERYGIKIADPICQPDKVIPVQ